MASPFPGMDPYIEAQMWADFHARVNIVISEMIVAAAPDRYFVRVEKDVVVTETLLDERGVGRREDDETTSWTQVPDVDIVRLTPWSPPEETAGSSPLHGGGVAVADPPPVVGVETVAAELRPYRDETDVIRFLTVRTRDDDRIVTVIETLSPTNKQSRRAEYLSRRSRYLRSQCSLVELDLLLGGRPMPTIADQEGLVERNDYFALVSAWYERPRVLLYRWKLEAACPSVLVPLSPSERPISVDLQAAITTTWQRAGYDRGIRHDRGLPREFVSQAGRIAELVAAAPR